ncbi:MAG: mobile mystery protein B [Bdellovibrionota bacterium]
MSKKEIFLHPFTPLYGQTELTNDDKNGLKLTDLKTKFDVYNAEAENISKASNHFLGQILSNHEILDDLWLRQLHKLMFEDVWEWAGKYRQRDTNIGIDPAYIQVDLRKLCDDAKVWLEYNTYSITEIIIRFHHLLLKIHPFPDGNGRWARMACMCLANANSLKIDWSKVSTEENKLQYVAALKHADYYADYQKLISLMAPLFQEEF